MLFINKFVNEPKFINMFLKKVYREGYSLVTIEHSAMDVDNETDIYLLLEKNGHKLAILIENKVDAIAMPRQKERYDIRGHKGIEKGLYNKFFVFIVPPKDYFSTNVEAKNMKT